MFVSMRQPFAANIGAVAAMHCVGLFASELALAGPHSSRHLAVAFRLPLTVFSEYTLTTARSEQMTQPPDGLPIYRVLTGPDDASFCHRVSDALKLGYQLHGGPALTFNGKDVIVAQAVIWPEVHGVSS
jgi:hypothetical protein